MSRLLRLSLLIALLLTACAPAATPAPTAAPLRKIRLPMGYIPSVQYAPFYVAVQKGYFAAEGLEIEFDYSFETNGVQLVGADELPFAVVSGEQVLLARAQGLPVVYVLGWFQKYPVAVIAPAGAGVKTPADLRGKTVGVPILAGASYVGLRALLTAGGLRPEDLTIREVGFNQVEALTAGQVDAAVVYSNNEPIRLAAQGQKWEVLQVSDYAALAANGLLTNEAVIQREPELVRGLARALVRGMQAVLADQAAAYAICQQFVEGLKDDAVEQQVLAATAALWQADRPGWSDPQAWENMQATLLDAGLLTEAVDLSRAYTNEFVP